MHYAGKASDEGPMDKIRREFDGEEPSLSSDLVSLRWSSERPTDSGWYFVRIKGDLLDIEIVLVRGDTPTCPKYVLEHGSKDRYPLDRYTDECEWYGPLAVPEAN